MTMSTKNSKPTQSEEEKPVAELFLLHLRYKESRLVNVGGNAPILLTDPNVCWVVYKGSATCLPSLCGKGRRQEHAPICFA